MLEPMPKRPPSPLDELPEARWRTPSSSDGTPIALPSRFVSMPVGLAERIEPGEILFQLLIGEGDLILLRLARVRLRLLAPELRGQVAVTGAVVRGGHAICGA